MTLGLLIFGIILNFAFLINLENINNILATSVTDGKDYDLKEVKDDVYVVSSTGYNAMFLVTGEGVIVIDAPPSIGDKIFKAISEVTNETITHLIYSHSHKDHIGVCLYLSSAWDKNSSTKRNWGYSQNEK